MTTSMVVIRAKYDDDAKVWYVEHSDLSGVHAEGNTFDELCSKYAECRARKGRSQQRKTHYWRYPDRNCCSCFNPRCGMKGFEIAVGELKAKAVAYGG